MPTLLIGDTTIEAQEQTLYPGYTMACRFTAVTSGDITDFYLRIGATAGATQVCVCLYDNDAGNNRPGNLLHTSSYKNQVANTWLHWDSLVGWSVVNGTIYWLAWSCKAGGGAQGTTRFKDGSSNPSNQYQLQSTELPNPFGAPAAGAAREVSVYGEEIAVAGGGAPHSCLSPALLSIIECMREKKRVEDKKKLGLIMGLWFGTPVFEAES